jgi:hypothetical protein
MRARTRKQDLSAKSKRRKTWPEGSGGAVPASFPRRKEINGHD